MKRCRWIAILLMLLICVSIVSGPLCATRARADSFVYYSDLFYGYDPAYLKSDLVRKHIRETYDVTFDVFNAYCDSPAFKWTEIVTGLKAATSPVEVAKLYSSATGSTDYNYLNALDSANVLFVKDMFSNGSCMGGLSELTGKGKKFVDGAEDLMTVMYNLRANVLTKEIIASKTDDEIYEIVFQAFNNTNIFKKIGSSKLNSVLSTVLAKSDELAEKAETIGTALEVAEKLGVALMMENVRLEVIDELVSRAEEGTTLYDGMTRLQSQLEGGFVSYFCDTYLTEKVLIAIGANVIKHMMSDGIVAAWSFVTAIVDIFSYVVLDYLFKTPDLDDLLTQNVLCAYSSDLYDVLFRDDGGMIYEFADTASYEMISNFEILFEMYDVCTDLSLEASKKLTVDSTEDDLSVVIETYSDFTYDIYANDLVWTIGDIPDEERVLKHMSSFRVYSETMYVSSAEDILYDDTIYMCQGKFRGDITICGDVTMVRETGVPLIDGDLNVTTGCSFTIPNGEKLEVDGDIEIGTSCASSSRLDSATDRGKLINEGELICTGDLTAKHLYTNVSDSDNVIYEYGTYVQATQDAKLMLSGDLSFTSSSYCDITAGTVVLNGTEVQTLKNVKVWDFVVENPAGIRYLTSLYLYGTYDLKGNPLDNGEYVTYMYEGAVFTDGSDYKDVRVIGAVTLRSNIKGDVYIPTKYSLTIPAGETYTIDGDIEIGTSYTSRDRLDSATDRGKLINEGELICTGDLTANNSYDSSYSYYYSEYGTYVQTTSDAKLLLSGDLSFTSSSYCDITAGTVVLNGTEVQMLKGVKVWDLVVENASGIQYLTNLYLYGTYDLKGNPLDNGEYMTYMYEGAVFTDGSDYKDVRVVGAVTLRSNIKGDVYIPTMYSLTIPAGETYTIDGDIVIGASYVSRSSLSSATDRGKLINEGTLICTGGLTAKHLYTNVSDSDNVIYEYGTYVQATQDAKLMLSGDLSFTSSSYCDITAGTVVLNGTEVQTLKNVKVWDLVVENASGIQYLTSLYLYGTYDLKGNPLDNGEYVTYMYEGAVFTDGSDYKDVRVIGAVTLRSNIKGDVYIPTMYSLTIPAGETYTIDGDIEIGTSYTSSSRLNSATDRGKLINEGELICTGDLTANNSYDSSYSYYYSEYGTYVQTTSDAKLLLSGDLSFTSSSYCDITAGTVVLNGTEVQTLKNVKVWDLVVENASGIQYLTSLYLYGTYDLKGNPLDNGEYVTYMREGAVFTDGSDYKDVRVVGAVTLRSNIKGDVYIPTKYSLTIPAGEMYTIDGDIVIGTSYASSSRLDSATDRGKLINEGKLICTGDLTVNHSYDYSNSYYYSKYGTYVQTTSDAKLLLAGDMSFPSTTYCEITAGTVVLNGTEVQTLSNVKVYDLEVENVAGIRYLTNLYLYGTMDLNEHSIDQGAYDTVIKDGGKVLLKFLGSKMLVEDTVTVSYFVNASLFTDMGYMDPYVVFHVDDADIEVGEYTQEDGYYLFSCSFAKAQLDSGATATLYAMLDGNVCSGDTVMVDGTGLKEIRFTGNAPAFDADEFAGVVTTVYYPRNDRTWDAQVRQDYDGQILWVPYGDLVQPTLTLSYPTLSFEDEIFYNVYFTVDDISSVVEMGLMLLPSLMAEATIDDAIGTVPGYLTNGSLFMARSEGIPAAHMGDTVYFKVYAKLTDGSYAYSGAGGYNAKAYANTVLGGSYPEAMKSLVVAMVEYGAEAQLFFGHNIDKLVNAALTDEQKALVSSYDESMVDAVVAADSSKTANFVRVNSNFSALYPSVSFDGAFSINYYCTPAIPVDDGMTLYWWDAETYDTISAFTVENATGSMEMTATNGQYWGCVPGIAAKDMDKTYYVSCVFESEGEPITSGIIAYSLGKYCEGKAAANGDVQQAFAQATAVYGYYAKRYFAGIA